MSSGIALYYPYIEVYESWLKTSLLYWDKVRRIVPDGYQPSDSGDSLAAADEGLLVATSPMPYLAEVAQRFATKIPALLEKLEETRNQEDTDWSLSALEADQVIHMGKGYHSVWQHLISPPRA